MKLRLHFAKCRSGIRENVHPAKSQMPRMPTHIEEGNGPSPALRRVHPIARPGIVGDIALAAPPNIEAVKRVIKNGQLDTKQFNLLRVSSRTFGGKGV